MDTDKTMERKQLVIYLIVAYGVTYVMGLFMWYGNAKGIDVSAFPNAQMMYPAAGVMLAYLLTRREDVRMPKWFFRIFLVLTAVMIAISIVSVMVPYEISLPGAGGISLWLLMIQYVIMIGSVVCWIFYFAAGKEKRAAYGLKWNNSKSSLFCILLFMALYIMRNVLAYLFAGQLEYFAVIILGNPYTWINMFVILINLLFVFTAFFGEEYGWRYYLQPLMQKKFGARGGVLLLGVVWGLWHLPVDFFYYSPETGLAAAAAQQITCITLGIFFAYAYRKTDNIWVPVILHFLNNNLIAVFSGNYSSDILQNQNVLWSQLPASLLVNGVVFGGFLASREFRTRKGTGSDGRQDDE